jgi:3-deoxy-D-manno-octulosonic-acid transferase
VLAQTAEDAERLRAMGGAAVEVTGNLKFDMAPDAAQIATGRAWRAQLGRPVVLAASTREGEEAPLLDAWRSLAAPRPLLLLVPRHPQRFDEVAALVAARGLAMVRRSALPPLAGAAAAAPAGAGAGAGAAAAAVAAAATADADVVLGDSMGEMALYYAAADVALLGGSFAPLGGQNLIEAAACGCPLVMGPHTFNFAQAAEWSLEAGAAERVDDLAAGVARAVALAASPQRDAMAERASAFAARHRGAAMRTALALEPWVPASG